MQNAGNRGRARDHAPGGQPRPSPFCAVRKNMGGGGFVVASPLRRQAGGPVACGAQGRPARRRGIQCGGWSGGPRVEERDPGSDRGRGLRRRRPVGSGLRPQMGSADHRTHGHASPARLPLIASMCRAGVMGDTGEQRRAAPADLARHLSTQEARSCVVGRAGNCARRSWLRISAFLFHVLEIMRVTTGRNDPALWRGQKLPAAKSSGNKYTRDCVLSAVQSLNPMTGRREWRRGHRGTASVPASPRSRCRRLHSPLCRSPHQHHGQDPAEARRRLGTHAFRSRYTAFLIGPGAGVNDAHATPRFEIQDRKARCSMRRRSASLPRRGRAQASSPRTLRHDPA